MVGDFVGVVVDLDGEVALELAVAELAEEGAEEAVPGLAVGGVGVVLLVEVGLEVFPASLEGVPGAVGGLAEGFAAEVVVGRLEAGEVGAALALDAGLEEEEESRQGAVHRRW